MFSMVTDLETVPDRATVEYPVHRGRLENDVQHVVLHYLVERWRLAAL